MRWPSFRNESNKRKKRSEWDSSPLSCQRAWTYDSMEHTFATHNSLHILCFTKCGIFMGNSFHDV